MKLKLTLTSIPPSKKNNRIMRFGKKPVSLPSKQYTKWHEVAFYELIEQKRYIDYPEIKRTLPIDLNDDLQITRCNCLEVEFISRYKYKKDIDNTLTSLLDFLVDTEIFYDDNWYVIPKIITSFKQGDEERTNIIIT